MNKLVAVFLSLILSSGLFAQISLDNGSFEGEAEDATMPSGWLACKKGTTPDILPGAWGVYHEPSEGDTYIGLITRSDKTWESIGQRLKKPLDKNVCYSFNVDLAHSNTYTGYSKPTRLRIWGGKTLCSRTQLLWESDVIDHTEWETYECQFETKASYNYIIFEAYFPGKSTASYKGNILIDNASDIIVCKRA